METKYKLHFGSDIHRQLSSLVHTGRHIKGIKDTSLALVIRNLMMIIPFFLTVNAKNITYFLPKGIFNIWTCILCLIHRYFNLKDIIIKYQD